MGNCTVVHDGNSKAYPYQFSRVYGETLEALNDLTSDGRMDYRTLGDILQLLGRLSDASLHDQELAVMRFRLRLDEIRRSRRDESSPDVDRLRAERDPYPHTE